MFGQLTQELNKGWLSYAKELEDSLTGIVLGQHLTEKVQALAGLRTDERQTTVEKAGNPESGQGFTQQRSVGCGGAEQHADLVKPQTVGPHQLQNHPSDLPRLAALTWSRD